MTTKLNKVVSRETETTIPYKGSKRRIMVVTLCPNDTLEFRPKGTRQRITLPLLDLYYFAIKLRAAQIKVDKAAKRKARGGK